MENEGLGATATAERGTRSFDCPECRPGSASFPTPELLGVHLERHRPVDGPQVGPRGKPLTRPCPAGCGRHFLLSGSRAKGSSRDYDHHKEICDGSPPIVGAAAAVTGTGQAAVAPLDEKKEATTVAKLSCEKGCGKTFTHQAWKEKHEARCDGTVAKPARKPRAAAKRPLFRPPVAASTGAGPIAAAIAQLRTRREEIIATHPELLEIEQAIEALEKVQASGARPT